ncbi:MAG: helicase SNF2 [bacterium]|nr:helicase SNF2 [bacterium]
MPLHKRSASHFQRGDRQRGKEYHNEGRVRLQVDGTRARARVDGNSRESYAVGLDWSAVSERVLHAFCECPRFADRRPCKHVWATLLALAEIEPEQQPPGRDRVSLRKDRATSWQDLGINPNPNGLAPGRRAHHARPARQRRAAGSGRRTPAARWRTQLATVDAEARRLFEPSLKERAAVAGASSSELRLLIDTTASQNSGGMVLDVFGRKRDTRGRLGKLRRMSVAPEQIEALFRSGEASEETEEPVNIIAALPTDPPPNRKKRGRRKPANNHRAQVRRLRLPGHLLPSLLPRLCERGALGWWDGRKIGNPPALSWDDGSPWRLALRLEEGNAGGTQVSGLLERGEESVSLKDPALILADSMTDSLVVFPRSIARFEISGPGDMPWITQLRGAGEIVFPKEDLEEALSTLLELPNLPRLEAPEKLQLSAEPSPPQPRLFLEADAAPAALNLPLLAELSFDYGNVRVSAADPRPAIVDWQEQLFVRREMEIEHGALVRLLELGLRPVESAGGHDLELSPRDLPAVAEPLLADGWTVEAQGTTLRRASPPALRVESGIDWFELHGDLDFAGDPVELKKVLETISRGDRFIELADGSQGLLPESWMETFGSLSQLAQDSEDSELRFLPSQAMLVDALLTAMPPADVDGAFAELHEKLVSFERIKPKRELKSFNGTLRGYQRQGLGWLEFLREFGLGGVLADDMGLGKTVQVLALLHANRTPSKSTKLPSLVVAPRSLVYNWIDEASRFTPKLKVIEYAGVAREALQERLGDFDLVVTTYGTMRRDIGFLATVELDTVILDEAQAIKNPASQTAKASNLLVGRHRLALTGTPIENHLGELGSLFEFLNPGFLGRLPQLEVLITGRIPSQSELQLVAQGIRPFILRRTKAQVLPDLPPKTEQVLFCSLRPEQREIYDQVRAGYQASLLEQVEKKGVGGSAIQVLEALLRLRQVACHPGLVNPEWDEAGSAKLETLFEQVSEILDEGHKVLLFSQFTKLLAYVRRHLDEQEQPYAYLDGQTRNRAEEVERFQTDPECNLFLVSLKAGGVGLNLTAAEYVFLLDPWWNPAVEAQAIDRAHRIGQDQPVFAYRMIARDTVEEKILELQRSKRQIADAILEGEGQSLRDLTADDLRMLLS